MTDLTEQWKKGELKLGEHYYYTTIFSPTVYIQNFTRDVISFQDFKETVAEVLAPVPSYDEWKVLNGNMDSVMQTNKVLCQKLAQLKELLKECKVSVLNLLSRDVIECNGINQAELLVEIEEVQDD